MGSNFPVKNESSILRAVEAMEARKFAPRRWHQHPSVWGFGGVAVGAGLILAWTQFSEPKQPVATNVPIKETTGGAAQQLLAQPFAQLPLDRFPSLQVPKAVEQPAANVVQADNATPGPEMSGPETPSRAMPRRSIRGQIRPEQFSLEGLETLPSVSVEPIRVDAPTVAKVKQETSAELVTVSQDTASPEEAVKHISSLAKRLGGAAQPEGKTGVIAFVPPSKVNQLIDGASAKGLAVRQQSWSGQSKARQDKLAEDVQERIAGLKKKKEELLLTFYEDAVPVKHVTEDIAAAEAELAKLRSVKNPKDKAIVRFKFVG